MSVRTQLRPGTVSPTLAVPAKIERPEYAWKPTVNEGNEPWVQTAGDHREDAGGRPDRRAGAAGGGQGGRARASPPTRSTGSCTSTSCDHGAYPSTLGYQGFPKSCCTSLNEVICHGIPDSTVIEDGDIVNIDVTAYIDGVHGDTNATFLAGDVAEENRLLVERTHEATHAGDQGGRGRAAQLNVIGRVIESYAKRFGYGVVRDFTGHGIGRDLPLRPGDPALRRARACDTVIEPGMTFTIEPMITLGTIDYDMWDDDWTVVTKDRKWTAQFEHTLVVTETGTEILTLP